MDIPNTNSNISKTLSIHVIYNSLCLFIDSNIDQFSTFLKEAEIENKKFGLMKKEMAEQEDDITSSFGRFFTYFNSNDFYFQNQSKTLETNATTDIGIIAKKYSKHRLFCFIEAKRLPTPESKDREKTEYVYYESASKQGGIERFKTEKHGGKEKFPFSFMLGYIQEKNADFWFHEVNNWIGSQIELSSNPDIIWSENDKLNQDPSFSKGAITKYYSTHSRKTLDEIKLVHYWIDLID